jgi:hypothetical protein
MARPHPPSNDVRDYAYKWEWRRCWTWSLKSARLDLRKSRYRRVGNWLDSRSTVFHAELLDKWSGSGSGLEQVSDSLWNSARTRRFRSGRPWIRFDHALAASRALRPSAWAQLDLLQREVGRPQQFLEMVPPRERVASGSPRRCSLTSRRTMLVRSPLTIAAKALSSSDRDAATTASRPARRRRLAKQWEERVALDSGVFCRRA